MLPLVMMDFFLIVELLAHGTQAHAPFSFLHSN